MDWSISPIEKSDNVAFKTRLVSDTLVKLCISYMFGDGSSLVHSADLDLVSTGLVMVSKNYEGWNASMTEPLVLSASLNFLADQKSQALMDYFASHLFSPLRVPNLTAQERGNMMECVIALRFLQRWWLDPNLQKFLPDWFTPESVPTPVGVMDCRSSEDRSVNMFLQQLRNPLFPWIVLPSTNAGPDLRYAVFCCYVKTSWTRNSQTTIFVKPEECKSNIETMNPSDWYKSQKPLQTDCSTEIQSLKFIHLRFELPYTAPSMRTAFVNGPGSRDGDYTVCADLDSEFTKYFFGAPFAEKYKEFLSTDLDSEFTKYFFGAPFAEKYKEFLSTLLIPRARTVPSS